MGQKNSVDIGGTIVSVLSENKTTFDCQLSEVSSAYTALVKDNIQCNVDVTQTVSAGVLSCNATFADGPSVVNAISESLTSALTSKGVTEYNGTDTSFFSSSVSETFLNSYENECTEHALTMQSLVLVGDTISCCKGWAPTANGLSCTSLGTLNVNQTILAPRLQCALNAALAVVPAESTTTNITESNTPTMPWYVFVALAVLAVVVIIGLAKTLR